MIFGLAGGLAAQDANQETDQAAKQTEPDTSQVNAGAQALSAAENETTNNGAKGDSHVRIVRLSDAQGTVAMDRGTGKGYEPVMQNMPIVEGARLQTDDGYAEVEFEDGSTMRLTPDSRVEFPQLVLRAAGAKVSTVKVERGTVYLSLENSKDNEFTVKAGQATMAVAPSTHMRLELTWPKTVVAVYTGNVQVQSGGTTTALEKKQSATLDATDASKVDVSKKVAEATYDGWDKQQVDYHKHYANAKSYAGGGYGVSDLNYYGSFVSGPCGTMWQPYFVSAAWDPYANGAWAYYPGAGYSWVSPYPWGWLPYHTGAWSFCPGMGWGWQPGGAWRGLANVSPGVTAQPLPGKAGQIAATPGAVRPVGPPRPPAGAMSQTLVMENRMPLVYSRQSEPGNFVFQRDSAGMGVPRGSLGELRGLAGDVHHHGSVSMPVVADPMTREGAGGNSMHHGPVALRQASPGDGGNWQNHHADGANAGGPQSRAGAANNQGAYHGGGNGAGAGAGNGSGQGAAPAPRVHTVDPSTSAPTSAPEAGPRAQRPH
jgi:ferric-dicitrate binding protein FerR (iron transport regulator)